MSASPGASSRSPSPSSSSRSSPSPRPPSPPPSGWRPAFPGRNPWSHISYARVRELAVDSLSPANLSSRGPERTLVMRTPRDERFAPIPPGDSAWETRVRIVGLEVDELPPEELFADTFDLGPAAADECAADLGLGDPVIVPDDEPRSGEDAAAVRIGDVLSMCYAAPSASTSGSGATEPAAHTPPVYVIQGQDVDRMVIRTDESTQIVPAAVHRSGRPLASSTSSGPITVRAFGSGDPASSDEQPARKITIRPAPASSAASAPSVSVSKIIVRDGSPATPSSSTRPTHAWLPITQCASRSLNDLAKDLALLCTIKRRNLLDIQLHVACHRSAVIWKTYDALNHLPDLRLFVSTQTTTRRSRPSTTPPEESGRYEICIRSDNDESLLEAARICRERSEKAGVKCLFRISTNTHTYD